MGQFWSASLNVEFSDGVDKNFIQIFINFYGI